MSLPKIRVALESWLGTMAPALPTVPQNTKATPVTETPFQECYVLPATPDNPTLGDGHYREIGVFQVSLMYPQNAGAGAAEARSEAIKLHFKRARVLTQEGVNVLILRTPAISAGRIDRDRWRVDVSIRYQAEVFE